MQPNDCSVIFTFFGFLFALHLQPVHLCTSNIGVPGPTGTALQRKMGNFVREVGLVPDHPDTEIVTDINQLTCNSRDRQNCCWRQNRDTDIKWVAAAGIADASLVRRYFGQPIPTGPGFLASYTDTAKVGDAILESCVVPCVSGDVDVALESWQSSQTSLEVCVTPAEFYSPQNCQPLRKGADRVRVVPLDRPMRIVVKASSFVEPTGSVVALDNLNVNANLEDVNSCIPTTTDSPAPMEVCRKTTCSFDAGNSCSYQSLAGGAWSVRDRRIGNPNTGVRRAAPGSEPYYAGVQVPPRSSMVMKSGPLTIGQPLELQFQAYEATQDMTLKACINDVNNCPWQSNERVLASDLRWQKATIPIDSSVREILFVAENKGRQFGSAGVDDIRLFTSAGSEVNC